MRLPRALNLNENPAQFGIFFSANRLNSSLSALPIVNYLAKKRPRELYAKVILHP
uniref:Uncharacterized protein n=1 Tax=Candidatus Kentrum sp. FM TaxID=2126340 RepID=A0A450TU47_9GAMM|nr:MAG: hypothetical protein BECKFM1743A_GA0114220_106391 [Candidatus Kentron sp. FM]